MTFNQLKVSLRSKTLSGPIQLSKGQLIIDVDKFIDSHIKFLENNSGKEWFMPYYNRLVKLNRLKK